MDLMSDLIWKSWKLSTVWAILFNISCAVWEWPLFELGPFLLRINEPFCHICVKSFELQPCLDHWPLLMKAALLVLFLCSKVASNPSILLIKVGSTIDQVLIKAGALLRVNMRQRQKKKVILKMESILSFFHFYGWSNRNDLLLISYVSILH